MRRKIILREIDFPKSKNSEDELKWMFNSLGFCSGRDVDEMSLKIMMSLIEEFKTDKIIPTEKIANSLNVESPRVNHHLRNLMESGIILREKRKVTLRGGSLSNAIEEMKRDSDKMFERMIEISKRLDSEFGF